MDLLLRKNHVIRFILYHSSPLRHPDNMNNKQIYSMLNLQNTVGNFPSYNIRLEIGPYVLFNLKKSGIFLLFQQLPAH